LAHFQTNSTRRSCAQLGSSVPLASRLPRGRVPILPPEDVTPSRSRCDLTDWARFSDRARLYSAVPRGSVWPTSLTARPTFLRQSAFLASVAVASVVSADSLKSKKTVSSRHSEGGGAGAFSPTQTPLTQS